MINTKLELTWIGKNNNQNIEPRILLRDEEKSYGEKNTRNMLIHGDNLLALKALEKDYSEKIKCIYIDPPYNTGAAFEHYDDNLEHSIWLNLMRERLIILYNLLDKEQGTIWISIDDDEQAYLKILCDEVFGRNNFVANIVWQKKGSRSNDAKYFSDNHDFIMVYAKNKATWKINKIPRGKGIPTGYSNPDNDPRGPWTSTIMSAKSGSKTLLYEITIPSGRKVLPPTGRYWSCSKETFEKWKSENRIWFGTKGDSAPRKKTFLSEVQEGLVPLTVWLRDEVGDNQEAKHEIKVLFPDNPFGTPKPERLIQRILSIATSEGDIVLDSFLGSGTTAAVAHKMKRKWIGIEMGDHCYTHCKKRIDNVIDNIDKGGITKSTNWNGGGGYDFYELAPSLIEKDVFEQDIINPKYNNEMLSKAVALHEDFQYNPSNKYYWKQSKANENSYLYVTTNFVGEATLDNIKHEMKESEYLIIACASYDENIEKKYKNIKIKKIPELLLENCEYGVDNYKLNVSEYIMEEYENE